MYCPNCGYKINQPAGGWTNLQTFEQSTALTIPGSERPAPPAFSSAYRKTPFRKQDIPSDVWVPLLQSLITGILAAVVFSVITPQIAGWPWYAGLIIGLFVLAMAWTILLWAGRSMLWVIEEVTGVDINQDGHIGKPDTPLTKIEVKDGHSTRLADLPGDEDLTKFCRWVAAGDSFSERTAQACGYGVTNFRKLRDIFISRRWAYWKNPASPQQGIELTLGGRHIIRELGAALSPISQDDAQLETSLART